MENRFGELSRWWWLIDENDSHLRKIQKLKSEKLVKWTDMIIAMISDILLKKCQ